MSMDRRKFVAGSAAAAGVVFMPAIVRAAQPLVVGTVTANSVHWVQPVAVEKGFYKAEGFDAQLARIQSSPQSVQFTLTGQYQVGTAQPDPFIAAFHRGATQLGAISSPSSSTDWLLVGGKDVKSLADLKGKTIGLSALRGSEAWATARILAAAGLKRGDYEFVISGVSPVKVAALSRGAIGAAVLFQPSAEMALRAGFNQLATYAGLRSYPTILYIVDRGWAKKDQNGIRAARALRKAHEWLWDKNNVAEAIALLQKHSRQSKEICEKVHKGYFVDAVGYSKTGAVDVKGLQTVLDDMATDGAVFKKAPEASKLVLEKEFGGMAG